MAERNRGRIVDTHEFQIWRYEDDSIDLNCRREGAQVDLHTAYMEAMVLARSLAEDLHQAQEIGTIKIYDSGLANTSYRTKGGIRSWSQFRWIKERLHSGGYNGLIGLPKPPEWLMLPFWWLEYCFSVNIRQWGLLIGCLTTAADSDENEGEGPTPPTKSSDTEEEPSENTAVVIPFPVRIRQD